MDKKEKDNLYSLALDGAIDIIELVSDEFAKEFQGKAPFDKEAMTKGEPQFQPLEEWE